MHASVRIRGTNDGCGGAWGVRFRTIRATRQPVISPGSPGDTVASTTTPHDSPGRMLVLSYYGIFNAINAVKAGVAINEAQLGWAFWCEIVRRSF